MPSASASFASLIEWSVQYVHDFVHHEQPFAILLTTIFGLCSSYYASKFTRNILVACTVFFAGPILVSLFLRTFYWLIPLEQHVGIVITTWIFYAYFPLALFRRLFSLFKIPALAVQALARSSLLYNVVTPNSSTLEGHLLVLPAAFLYIAGDLLVLHLLPPALKPIRPVSHKWTLVGLVNAVAVSAVRSRFKMLWQLPTWLPQIHEDALITAVVIFLFSLVDELPQMSLPKLPRLESLGGSSSSSYSSSSSSSSSSASGDMKIVHLGGHMVERPRKPIPSWNQFATLLIHADQGIEKCADVAPPIHVSTNFDMSNREGLGYAREDTTTRRRAEKVLGDLEGGTAVLFSSGLAAAFTALLHFKPKRVAIDGGYFGTHSVLKALRENTAGVSFEAISLDAEPQKGDVWWLESPKNPRCELVDIEEISKRVHAAGGFVVVDATFASPVLLQPLRWGADVVMHSTTKFLNGHSDAMGGALVSAERLAGSFHHIRSNIGNIPGELECWLLLRSLRTLVLRVERQSASAAEIARWLSLQNESVEKVYHPSLRDCAGHEKLWGEGKQMRMGPGILSFELRTAMQARILPQHVRVWANATSLGGVESLMDYRHRYDSSVSPKLLRISVGLEAPQDLIADLQQAFTAVAEVEKNTKTN